MEQAQDKKEAGTQEKKLSRHQEREYARLKEDADKLHGALCTRFLNFFLNNDPESIEVQDKIKEVSAKWKQYCHHNHIIPKLHDSVQRFCDDYIKEYREKRGPYIQVDWKFMFEEKDKEFANLFKQHVKVPLWIRKIFNAI